MLRSKINQRLFSVLILLALSFTGAERASAGKAPEPFDDENIPPTIAIIIDDMGNYRGAGWQLINLPYPLTFSFLPKRPFTLEQAKSAHFLGKEIMMHAPMTNVLGMKLGFGALTENMTEAQIKATLRQSLEAVPYVQGVNNHMGSQLTQKRLQMSWVMQTLSKYPVYFIDSRTIGSSVAGAVAEEYQIPTMGRDVFLDNWQTFKAINFQFKRLIKIAKRHGTAIAIGHPHQATADYLAYALPKLDQEGIAIASISRVWEIRNRNRSMQQAVRENNPPSLAHFSPNRFQSTANTN